MDMHYLDHLAAGPFTPAPAYFLSAIGWALGLRCTGRAHQGPHRLGWLFLASITIGGIGIWAVHIVTLPGPIDNVRFDSARTVLGAVLVIGIVGLALRLVSVPVRKPSVLLTGGMLAGAALGAVHLQYAPIEHEPVRIALSLLIAMSTATATLWFGLCSRSAAATAVTALTMAAGVAAVHFLDLSTPPIAEPNQAGAPVVLGPLVGAVCVVATGLLLGIGIALAGLPRTPVRGGGAHPGLRDFRTAVRTHRPPVTPHAGIEPGVFARHRAGYGLR